MSVTLVTTYGSSTSNCYVSITEANSIITLNTLNSEVWDIAGEDNRSRALVVAANNIDALRWAGSKYFYDQRLQFPRTPAGVDREDISGSAGSPEYLAALESNIFQKYMKERVGIANAVQALYLLQQQQEGSQNKHRKLQRQGVTSWSRSVGGSISESYSYGRNELVCPEAWEQLYHYKGVSRVVRGDSQSFSKDS